MAKLAIVLHEPDIPQNTGNIIRLCAVSGAELHLIRPLGWGELNDTRLRRSGLDYHEYVNLVVHDSYANCRSYLGHRPWWAVETSGIAYYHQVNYSADAVLLFGSETRGLPQSILDELGEEQIVRLPMQANKRSLNLANSVAITLYEAWRQLDFTGSL